MVKKRNHLFAQNPEQIFYRHLFYFNNISHADRPQWGQNFQAYLSDQSSLDDYLKKGEQQLIEQAHTPAGRQRSPDPELTASSMSALSDHWARLMLTDPRRFSAERILEHARWALARFAPSS